MTPPGEKGRDLCRARGTLFSDRHVSCRHDGHDRKRIHGSNEWRRREWRASAAARGKRSGSSPDLFQGKREPWQQVLPAQGIPGIEQRHATVGAVDTGGASLQINNPDQLDPRIQPIADLGEYLAATVVLSFPTDARRATVLARVVISSDREQEKKLNFGFSDEGSIILNGRSLFSGNNTYRSRSFRYLGAVTIDNDAVYLPLRRGENELVIAVSEAFGGWGLMARLEDLDSIIVEAASP